MRNIRASPSQKLHAISENESYLLLSNLFASNPPRVWTSLYLYDEYVHLGGTSLSRKELIQRLLVEYKNDIVLLSSPGIANILVFKSKASSILRIQMLEDEDDGNLQAIAKNIVSEIKNILYDKDEYQSKIDLTSCQQDVSPSLAKLLSYVPSHLSDNSLPSVLIGNIVTSMASNRYASLQVGLAILM